MRTLPLNHLSMVSGGYCSSFDYYDYPAFDYSSTPKSLINIDDYVESPNLRIALKAAVITAALVVVVAIAWAAANADFDEDYC